MIQRFTGVIVTTDDVAYIVGALEEFVELLTKRGEVPHRRLPTLIHQLRQTADNGSGFGSNGRKTGRKSTPKSDFGNDAGYALISVAEAARRLDCTERNIRDLAARGSLRAERVGGRWLLDPDAVTERARLVADSE